MLITSVKESEHNDAQTQEWVDRIEATHEAHNFQMEFNIDVVPMKVYRMEMKLENYDFKKATTESRLEVYVHFEEQITGTLKAAKENCDVLRDVVIKYLKPRLQG